MGKAKAKSSRRLLVERGWAVRDAFGFLSNVCKSRDNAMRHANDLTYRVTDAKPLGLRVVPVELRELPAKKRKGKR